MRFVRPVLAVLAGAVTWAILWLSGTRLLQALFPAQLREGEAITSMGALAALVALSVVLSVLAGFVSARVGGPKPMPAVWALAALQLALGIIAERSYWELMPTWYHLVFLALIVPATVGGGLLRRSATTPSGSPRPQSWTSASQT